MNDRPDNTTKAGSSGHTGTNPAAAHRAAGPEVMIGTAALRESVGRRFGPSPTVTVSADRVDLFLRATGAPPEDLPSVAPSNLVLALTNMLLPELVRVEGVRMGVNYGTDEVRFPAPTPVGSEVYATVELADVSDVSGGVQTRMVITVSLVADAADETRSDDPVCVVESLSRFFD